MSRQERKTDLVQRFRAKDASGHEHTIEEWGNFMRTQEYSGGWTSWMRVGGGKLKTADGQPVNETEDDSVFTLAATGEKLTVIAPPPKE